MLTHQGRCPKALGYLRGSHSHWLLWLGVLTLQDPTKEKRAVRIQALLFHQCRRISADVMSVPHVEGKTGRAIAARLLLRTGEVSRELLRGQECLSGYTKWFEHGLCSAALLFLSLQCSHTGTWLQNIDV